MKNVRHYIPDDRSQVIMHKKESNKYQIAALDLLVNRQACTTYVPGGIGRASLF